VGSRARLGNGPAHRPRASSNSEPNRCSSSAFSPSFLAFFALSHSFAFFILAAFVFHSERPPLNATRRRQRHPFSTRSIAAASSTPAFAALRQQPPPPSSFSPHVLLPARHAVFPLCFRLRPRPCPAARFRAAAPPMPLTPRRCLSPAARAHDIRTPQPPLRRQQWTLDLTCFVVTSARPSRFVLISTFPSSLRHFS
jgi:hypothetical protein